ncbi:MAG: Tol-Pal system beta propeller repeat protein TolB [Nitrospirae bacterium 13_1_20CM_2_62_14]|nr:MAG: Tol-Pal system beta propeller repeat protein TolB [Nitrospirae bacterium 13_1_40CM_4_62_6]OLC81067.1 MAG: Tol-Pal system beta propeller repeat protein TolB [Nitrospirae bacterium 13_1_40CM_3_62_11]OLD40866.1 MAG: Tol-Pal system beta propeller repeat protein TolB [Nitrospirae bacterium 13_1_40CM_2_62_10]OLD74971.1 MAG: Tol-Pal system beta propeller repeat protein TolB [Nitrospirae bacterium 13_1_20CM_4_62_6]OLE41428.1 MAG: Tol-Pal system beta propeller repeat protein TolB [Nitrospirae ba
MRQNSIVPVIAYLVLGAGFVGIMESGAADVFLEATRPDFQKIPVGVLEFQSVMAPANAAERVAEVLKADLRRSQIFSVADLVKLGIKVDEKLELLDGAQLPLFKQAADNGVAALVWGKMATRDANLVLDGYVYDGGTAELLIGKRYVGAPSTLRVMAHRLADELVSRYTGEPGIARTKIAYASDQRGGREVFVMDYDGYAPRQVTADGFLNLTPEWSRDRRSLVFTAYRNRRNQTIDLIELATGKRRTLVALAGLNITPSLSPDGRYLAFATSQDGNSEIYTLDTRTNELQRLTFQAAGDLSPFWSPSGRELVFTSDRGGGPQIYLMNADGSNVRRLTFEGDYNAAPAWSPRGDWIAFVCRSQEGQFKLCLITPDGQKRLQITTGPGIDDSPSWSPDGRHLVFSSMVNGQSHIFMINRDGTEQERLTSGGTHHSSPSWSPA